MKPKKDSIIRAIGMIIVAGIATFFIWTAISEAIRDNRYSRLAHTYTEPKSVEPKFNSDPASLPKHINDSWYPVDLKDPVIQKWVKAVERFKFVKGDRDHCLKIIVDSYWDTFDSEGQLDLVNMIWGFWISSEIPKGKAWDCPVEVVDENGKLLTQRPFV